MTKEQIALSMAYKNTFDSEHGKKVLEDLDRQCFGRNSGNPFEPTSERQTCFNLGKNAVVRYIRQEIERNLTETEDNKAIHKETI